MPDIKDIPIGTKIAMLLILGAGAPYVNKHGARSGTSRGWSADKAFTEPLIRGRQKRTSDVPVQPNLL